ncbi:MAG: 4Fe-4S binding protein, partial [Kiritimatiellae bacterium]|nr:4Fe-4S binding protein [Kiritimatiellia bacterium]
GAALAKLGAGKVAAAAKRALGILPPGAGDPARFASRCTGCLRCVGVCPSGILKPAEGGLGPVRIDLSAGVCAYDCHRCAEACPTGAIQRMPLEEKKRTKIAKVEFHATHCVVYQGESHFCGKCAEACPAEAIELRKNGAPKPPKPDRCIGCGACQLACPGMHADDDPEGVVRKAMRVVPLETP